jgi:manganese transport protein
MADPYQLIAGQFENPPTNFLDRIRHLGPGFILSATIVGSGELIATTTLGARAGFITFWVIIVSCLVKVAVQIEFTRHTILTGRTSMQIIGSIPGPDIAGKKWSVWLMLLLMIFKLFQVGGIVGGVAIIMNIIVPSASITLWSFIIAVIVALLTFQGYYKHIERFSLLMIAFFTLFTALSLYFVRFTPYNFSWSDVFLGLQFQLPKEAVAVAIGAFGITGVGGEEILYYNYWCLEKGYSRFTGPEEDTNEWRSRAKGWMKTMYLDAILAMILYTFVTAIFYLLGSSVLYSQGKIPEGYQMIEILSGIYTDTLGPGAKTVFLAGAFLVLFSTLFGALASWTRLWPDIFAELKWFDFYNPAKRKQLIAILAWVFPLIWALLFAFIKLPVIMVLSGGIAGSIILFLIVYTTFHLRYYKSNPHFVPGLFYDVILWISFISIAGVGIYGVYKLI